MKSKQQVKFITHSDRMMNSGRNISRNRSTESHFYSQPFQESYDVSHRRTSAKKFELSSFIQ